MSLRLVSGRSAQPPPDDTAHVLALLSLPEMGPKRLDALLQRAGGAEAAWALLPRWRASSGRLPDGADLRGRPERLFTQWAAAASAINPAALLEAHHRAGLVVLRLGQDDYPEPIAAGPEPPILLFARGDLGCVEAPKVAMVGTRRATPYGMGLARSWGAELASLGVVVVSGLAKGIDTAAHDGALRVSDATPVGVIGTGHDVVYPPSNRDLWRAVADRGLLLGEAPLGAPPEPWRFPARNRIMATLAEVVVVVESHRKGGALITAEYAAAVGRTVLAVPGSVHSGASAGTNKLLRDGAGVATSVADILTCLGLAQRPVGSGRRLGGAIGETEQPPPPPDLGPQAAELLTAVAWEPATLEELVERTGWSLPALCTTVDQLLRAGILRQSGTQFIREAATPKIFTTTGDF